MFTLPRAYDFKKLANCDRYVNLVSDMADPKSIELIRKLIAFDTTSSESNLVLITYVQEYLSSLGVESMLVHNVEGSKANLYATVGDPDTPGIMLSGHTDVVPVDGQDWDTDPFELVAKDGRLYGPYGFYDAFNPIFTWPALKGSRGKVDRELGWLDDDMLGIDQGPILSMIANVR